MYFKDEGAGEEEDTLHVSALGHVYKQTKRFFFVYYSSVCGVLAGATIGGDDNNLGGKLDSCGVFIGIYLAVLASGGTV